MDLPLEPRLSIGYQNVLAPTGYDDEKGAAAGRDLPETVRLLDSLGFDSIWSGDHVAFAGPILDPLVQLAQAVALSDRLTVGTAVYLLPLRHPAPVAKQLATLDTMSNGRVIFGVGVGGEFPIEFQLCGVPVEERGARLSEGIRVLRKLWSGRPVAHDGRFYPFPEVAISPPPARPGGPPIWCGGRSDPALRRAGRLADGWMSYVVDPVRYRRSLDRRCGGRSRTNPGPLQHIAPAVRPARQGPRDRAGVRSQVPERPLRDGLQPCGGALLRAR